MTCTFALLYVSPTTEVSGHTYISSKCALNTSCHLIKTEVRRDKQFTRVSM